MTRGTTGGRELRQAGRVQAAVLGWPGGRFLVGAAALGVIAFAAYSAREGVRREFLATLRTAEMPPSLRRASRRIGTAAYVTRGVVLALVGWFLLQAAITFDPREARGLDGALRAVADASWGPALLTGIALGLLCYGVFCLLEARYRRVGSSATGTA